MFPVVLSSVVPVVELLEEDVLPVVDVRVESLEPPHMPVTGNPGTAPRLNRPSLCPEYFIGFDDGRPGREAPLKPESATQFTLLALFRHRQHTAHYGKEQFYQVQNARGTVETAENNEGVFGGERRSRSGHDDTVQ